MEGIPLKRPAPGLLPLCREPLRERLDDRVFLGEGAAAAKESGDDTRLVLRRHQLAAVEDVELTARARLDFNLQAELIFDSGGETRRPGFVPSSTAVEDLDVHRSLLCGASTARYAASYGDRARASRRQSIEGDRSGRRAGSYLEEMTTSWLCARAHLSIALLP